MIRMAGSVVFGGIARGRLTFYHRDEIVINKLKVVDSQREFRKYTFAKNEAVQELKDLYEQATIEIGEVDAQIFQIHMMIIDDSQYESSMEDLILNEHYNADYAVAKTAQMLSKVMSDIGSESEYISERVADIKDVSDRIIRHIQNRTRTEFELKAGSIICADDFMPSETIMLDKSKIVAFCTSFGSKNSHTAILARTRAIPSIIGLGTELADTYEGIYAIVDGYSGILYIEPDEDTIKLLDKKEAVEGRKKELLRRLTGRKNITRDGKQIEILANIGGLSDVTTAKENDCGGVGLFRSEYLYLGKGDYPNEELQFYNYRRALDEMQGKVVTIRTMDIGADKDVGYFGLDEEKNPAIGFRAIRLSLDRPDVFKTQLRAMYRASVYGKLKILLPLIIDVEEIRKAKELIEVVKKELDEEGKPYSDDVQIGALIETPAAVMISDLLAKEVDFFSIGTNDLEQYTTAIDRENPHYEQMCPQHHIPVLRMIKMVSDNAHAHGIPVQICGELGSDTSLTEIFLDMHIDGLSVSPLNILPVRKVVRSLDLSDRKRIHENIQKTLRY